MTDILLPKSVAAALVAGHLTILWNQWTSDNELPGCCPECCAPCHALRKMVDIGLIDDLYATYMTDSESTNCSIWDPEKKQVRRDFLNSAWSVPCPCHDE